MRTQPFALPALLADLRDAVRLLRHHRACAITLIAVLGLTAGVTAAALDIVAAYLWRPFPYPQPDRLVVVDLPRANGPSLFALRRIDWTAVHELADLTVAWDIDAFTVSGDDAPFAVDGRWMTADAFAMFGATPAAGRFFSAEEARRGEPFAVISYELWRSRYGSSHSAIGRSITVRASLHESDTETFTIVGVLPPRFWHIDDRTNLILPLKESRAPALLRLRPGVAGHEAAARLTSIVRTQAPTVAPTMAPTVAPTWQAQVLPARDAHVARIRPMLSATMAGVLLLGIVACANLAFLQMARGLARQRELAVRSTLGASGGALARQFLAEGIVTGGGAAALGLLVASLLLRGGVSAIERYLGRVVPGGASGLGGLGGDLLTPAAIVATCLGAGVLLALIMLVAARTSTPQAALAGHPAGTETSTRLRASQVIVGAQVAVAFALLVAAALMIRTAWHLGRVELGFDPRSVLSANVTLHEATYRSVGLRRQFFARLVERLEQLPGITHAGLTDWLPFRVGPTFAIEPESGSGSASGSMGTSVTASLQSVNPAYFPALRMRLLEGRLLTPDDRAGREQVAIVSRTLARAAWEAQPAVGQTFRIRFSSAPGRGFGPFKVVGVVEDSLRSLVNPTPPQAYLSFDQSPRATIAFLQISTSRPPLDLAPTVARIVREADPNLPLAAVDALDRIVDAEGVRPRFLAQVFAGFATLAVTVAVIGLYAVSAWIAGRRQREAAVRVALGAGRGSVALLLARRGFIATVGGLAAGWLAAGALASMMASELHGVAASDLSTRLLVAAVLTSTSAVALWGPAWRAATANLSALLRSE